MNPNKFVEIWEAKHQELSNEHRELMLQKLLEYEVRLIEERWVREVIEKNGLKKLDEIIPAAHELQSIDKSSLKSTEQSVARVQGNPKNYEYQKTSRARSEKSKSTKPLKAFYSLGMTEEEEKNPDIIILDANVILTFEEWALSNSTKMDYDFLNESVKPVLKLLRKIKYVAFEQGALESSWPAPNNSIDRTENLINFNKNRMNNLMNLLHFLRESPDQEAETWIDSNRTKNLFWVHKEKYMFDFDNVKNRILENWLCISILIDQLQGIGHKSIVEKQKTEIALTDRINYFKRYLCTIQDLGLSLDGEVLFLARMAFFGGRIKHINKFYDFDEISKRNDWLNLGVLRIARNIAMDIALIRTARELRLSMSTSSKIKIAIITADRGLLAIYQYITKEFVQEENGKSMAIYRWPPESDMYLNREIFQKAEIRSEPILQESKSVISELSILKKLLEFVP